MDDRDRPRYDRDQLRYPSDLTDEEWSHVEPLIPQAKHSGRHCEENFRGVVNAIMYFLSTGCQWRYIPKDLPPRSTVHDYSVRWDNDGTLEKFHHVLYVKCRGMMGREASPTACLIDSQSTAISNPPVASRTIKAGARVRRSSTSCSRPVPSRVRAKARPDGRT